jgi:uncharacterized protein YjbI with pentapeptide repeats
VKGAVLEAPEHSFSAVDLSRADFAGCSFSGEVTGAQLRGFARAVFRDCRFEQADAAGVYAAEDSRALQPLHVRAPADGRVGPIARA